MPSGLLLLNKPAGVRSAVCVAIAKRRLNREFKIGHGGTLDSTAEGLLVLLIGGATRTSDLVMSLPKLYEAAFTLGEERSTDDYSGDTVFEGRVPNDARARIEAALPSFLGVRLQLPPGISAVRVGGRRAHAVVRSGEELSLRSRPVFVRSISLLPGEEMKNVFTIRVLCGKGTYIRSIVRDIGRMLGCGAYVLRLIRKQSGLLSLGQALPFEEFQNGDADLRSHIFPLARFAENFYCYEADEERTARLRDGLAVPLSSLRFSHEGILSPDQGAAVLGKTLFCYGRVLKEGFFKPKINIDLEGSE
ncbi:MAG TPA: tRNA pseudouridine(55) synthase TruB [Synergistales bacterium]|nr:tRNA pseudouridine(55) synthase TruB [Synergistales bacterium]